MYENLLPIGSVVNVNIEEDIISVMICSRIVASEEDNEIYDYAAVLYPQGFIDYDNIFLFDHEAIEAVLFLGCQNDAEVAYKEELSKLGKLKIENGQLIEE